MASSPRRAPSLLPVIAVLALALVAAVVLLATRGDDGTPATTAAGTTTKATDAPRGERPRDAATAREREVAGWPLQGPAAQRAPVPILMYHLVANAPAGTAYPDLWVAPERFRQQVDALRDAGFTAVTMSEVWAAWHEGGRLPRRPVVLSFDDGDITHALNVAPVLKQAGWPGVLNLAVNHLGKGGLPMWGAKRLLKQGWEIDSHTTDHLDLTTLDAAGLERELAGSRALLRKRLGVETRFLCYPAGRNDATVRAAARKAGYVAATTVDPGRARRGDDPFLLPRIRVEPTTTGSRLVEQARGTAAAPAATGAPA